MIKFDFLIPTHNSLRDPKSIRPMVDFVKEGRIFRCADKPIALTQFQDGGIYIRDGHRRLTAMLLAGARGMLDCEYVIEQMKYEDYLSINPLKGWVTPFDPRTECRLADFACFKDDAIALGKSMTVYPDKARNQQNSIDLMEFCKSGAYRYKEARFIHSLRDLVKVTFPNGCN